MAKTKQKRSPPNRLKRGLSYAVFDAAGNHVCDITVGQNRQMQAVPVGGATIRVTPKEDDRSNQNCSGK
jgi:hypothetical protein